MWILFFVLAVLCFAAALVFGIFGNKKRDFTKILFAGVVISSILLFIPIYNSVFKSSNSGVFEAVMISIHNMIRLFVVDGDFNFITDNTTALSGWLSQAYSVFFAVLFVLAPILTFGFVLSFFKNVNAYKSYALKYNADAFVFSELNDRSLALAKSLNKKKHRVMVFTDVFDSGDEKSAELLEQANAIGAICFKKDITAIDFSVHSKKRVISFFAIGNDESENIIHALRIIKKFGSRNNTNLYFFYSAPEAEMLFTSAFEGENENFLIKVRHVNEAQMLINRLLYEKGYETLYRTATDNNGVKDISALVVGMGRYGKEMIKALSWYGQMDGYRLKINAVDLDENAKSRFTSLCPGLMDENINGHFDICGEEKHLINVFGGIDVNGNEFDDLVASLNDTTYVFVAVGSDESNLSTAVKLRSLFLRMGKHPIIQAVICDTVKKQALNGVSNFKGQKYDIDFIGDLETSYSEETVLESQLEQAALSRHLNWGDEKAFWRYGYNYRSSVASVIHSRLKRRVNVPGANKKPEERTEEEKNVLRTIEHCRWNAYMRSEGYVYAPERNDLAKTHNCLVPYCELPEKEKEKDDF